MTERRFIKAIKLNVIAAFIEPGAAVLRKGSPVPYMPTTKNLCVRK
jgi:hypothetical protein